MNEKRVKPRRPFNRGKKLNKKVLNPPQKMAFATSAKIELKVK